MDTAPQQDTTYNDDYDEDEEEEQSGVHTTVVELGFAEKVPRDVEDEDEEDSHEATVAADATRNKDSSSSSVKNSERGSAYCSDDIAIATQDWSSWDGGKIGGRPLWMNTHHLPTRESLTCNQCGKFMLFLLQVYAPLDEEQIGTSGAFHRMIYVFVCPKSSCVGDGSVVVLRNQLAQENEFFPSRVSECREGIILPQNQVGGPLCKICGCAGQGNMDNCCSQAHRDMAKSVTLKSEYVSLDTCVNDLAVLLPEFEIVTEPEPSLEERKTALRSKYESLIGETIPLNDGSEAEPQAEDEPDISNLTQEELLRATGAEISADRSMRYFKERVSVEPEQILRYRRWNNDAILWAGFEGRPGNKAATNLCPNCGAERKFEFQIMPQIITYLMEAVEEPSVVLENTATGDLDFGTIVVYTCVNSCPFEKSDKNGQYIEEFAWVQMVS